MIHIGAYNQLEIVRATSVGFYLSPAGGEQEVLLPKKYISKEMRVHDTIEVFIYCDSEDRLVATTLRPKITVDTCAILRVKEVTPFGAFLDWGLEKDLLVPRAEQERRLKEGELCLVYLFLDESTQRLAGSTMVEDFLKEEPPVHEGDKVELLIGRTSRLGVEVVINNSHLGLLYLNEVFSDIKIGDRVPGYIKRIRPDGKIDVSLREEGYGQIITAEKVILEKLESNNGTLYLTDESTPGEITEQLGMSKKNFKKAIGGLYKKRCIVIKSDRIVLLQK